MASLEEDPGTGDSSYKSGGFGADALDAEMGERIDLTIACALLVGVASAVGMQELK